MLIFWKTMRKCMSDINSCIWRRKNWLKCILLINKCKNKFKKNLKKYRPSMTQRFVQHIKLELTFRINFGFEVI